VCPAFIVIRPFAKGQKAFAGTEADGAGGYPRLLVEMLDDDEARGRRRRLGQIDRDRLQTLLASHGINARIPDDV